MPGRSGFEADREGTRQGRTHSRKQEGRAQREPGQPFGGRWRGATVVCIASGPSLTRADCEVVRRWRSDARPAGRGDSRREPGESRKVIAVNNCWQLAPWANAIYACDRLYWAEYAKQIRDQCSGEFWTINKQAATVHGLNLMPYEDGSGPPFHAGILRTGGNSGYQAVNLAWVFGASRIILLGFDMGATGGRLHWHKDHSGKLHNPVPQKFRNWVRAFNLMASACSVPIINCSRESALTCFPRMDLDAGLAGTS